MANLRSLTDAESKRPYAKYYTRPMTPPAPGVYDAIVHPADPGLALLPGQINKLLEPGACKLERGWCQLPDGSGYVVGYADMPGVTIEMLDWWFAWHSLESLRYMIWDPEDHFEAKVKPSSMARKLDRNLSWRERNWDTTDIIVEDIGLGVATLEFDFLSPEAIGYNIKKFNDGGFTAINANGGPPGHERIICCTQNARPTKAGIELRSCFWLGWIFENGQPKRVENGIPPTQIAEFGKAAAKHSAKEYHNLAAILPSVYAENYNIIDKIEDF